jgi:hypothetical protein
MPATILSLPETAPVVVTRFPNRFTPAGTRLQGQWCRLAASLATHEVGDKDGMAICMAEFHGDQRGGEHLICRTGIALDIEASKLTGEVPPPPWEIVKRLRALKVASVVYTTHSHDEGDTRYRVVAPLSQPMLLNDSLAEFDPFVALAFAKLLRLDGVTDPSKLGAASLFFTARYPAGRANLKYGEAVDGYPVDFATITGLAVRLYTADMQSQRDEIRAGIGLDANTKAAIESFNQSHPLVEALGHYGYRQSGARWKSPLQSSGSVGATVIKRDGEAERWVSFSDSDAQAGLGRRPVKASPVTCFGDSFSLFRHFEHRGDFKSAINAARKP